MRDCRCRNGEWNSSKFGIDIEGYGEGDIDYEEPINVSIRNNHFIGNVSSSVTNFNGYGISIEGNHSDNTISYGYGTQTVIKGNILRRAEDAAAAPRVGITGLGVSQGKESSDAVIAGNLITGFSTGIDVRERAFLSPTIKSATLKTQGYWFTSLPT